MNTYYRSIVKELSAPSGSTRWPITTALHSYKRHLLKYLLPERVNYAIDKLTTDEIEALWKIYSSKIEKALIVTCDLSMVHIFDYNDLLVEVFSHLDPVTAVYFAKCNRTSYSCFLSLQKEMFAKANPYTLVLDIYRPKSTFARQWLINHGYTLDRWAISNEVCKGFCAHVNHQEAIHQYISDHSLIIHCASDYAIYSQSIVNLSPKKIMLGYANIDVIRLFRDGIITAGDLRVNRSWFMNPTITSEFMKELREGYALFPCCAEDIKLLCRRPNVSVKFLIESVKDDYEFNRIFEHILPQLKCV